MCGDQGSNLCASCWVSYPFDVGIRNTSVSARDTIDVRLWMNIHTGIQTCLQRNPGITQATIFHQLFDQLHAFQHAFLV